MPDPSVGPPGSSDNPIVLPGIDVSVSRWGGLVPWLVVGLGAWALYEATKPRRSR